MMFFLLVIRVIPLLQAHLWVAPNPCSAPWWLFFTGLHHLNGPPSSIQALDPRRTFSQPVSENPWGFGGRTFQGEKLAVKLWVGYSCFRISVFFSLWIRSWFMIYSDIDIFISRAVELWRGYDVLECQRNSGTSFGTLLCLTHSIHGTGAFTYIDPIKFHHSCG